MPTLDPLYSRKKDTGLTKAGLLARPAAEVMGPHLQMSSWGALRRAPPRISAQYVKFRASLFSANRASQRET